MTKPGFFRRFRLDWPLLGKELQEQAARRQTYVLRVCYAVFLFGAFCIYYFRQVEGGTVLALGGGVRPFSFIVSAQLAAILLFLPPIMAGAVAQEKERETLGLLFLTDLTPWELILQKYVGRLIPMLTLLFLSLPLMAVAYSLGGVSFTMLCGSVMTLFLTCLTVGAIALEASVYQPSTFQALLRCWGFCFVWGLFCFSGFTPIRFSLFRSMMGTNDWINFLVQLLPMAGAYLLPALAFLLLARSNLEKRAFVQRRNPFEAQFKQMDQYWKDVRKLTRALLRTRDREARAVAQEVVLRAVGPGGSGWSPGAFLMARMQIPTLLSSAIIIGSLVMLYMIANILMDPRTASFHVAVKAIWLLALLTVPILSANVVSRERTNERLGPLLTTPLTGREILGDWVAPLRQWVRFIMWPLTVVILLGTFLKYRAVTDDSRWTVVAVYPAVSVLAVLVYPFLVRWACLWVGLRIQNQVRAMMTALLGTAAWCFVPPAIFEYLFQVGVLPERWAELLKAISPATIIGLAEALGARELSAAHFAGVATAHLLISAALAWGIRHVCLKNADRYLGRV